MPIKINSKYELIQILEDIRRGNLPSDYLVGADFSGDEYSFGYFSGGDFSGVDFSWINMSKSRLSGVNLSKSNLSGTNLSEAFLSDAFLFDTDLSKANLSDAFLSKANLSKSNLSWTNLSGANLSWAFLFETNLSWAYLVGADLTDAILSKANLLKAATRDTRFHNTNVEGTIFPEGFENSLEFLQTRILPEEGSFIAWEKCLDNVLVKLRIPADAPRCHAFSRKCRAAYADVLEVIGGKKGISLCGRKITYEVGKRAYPDSFDEDWRNEQSNGIHFYITRKEAEAH